MGQKKDTSEHKQSVSIVFKPYPDLQTRRVISQLCGRMGKIETDILHLNKRLMATESKGEAE